MNIIQVELWQVVTAIGTIIAAFWALAKIISKQTTDNIDIRFKQMHEHMRRQDGDLKMLERQFSDLRAEMPRDYVRREDHTHVIASIKVSIENLALNMEKWMRSLLTTKRGED